LQKKWIFAGAAVLVVAGAMPWVVGYVTEQQWQAATQEVNHSQPFVKMTSEQYQRGFMASEFQGTLVLTNPETGQSQTIDYQANVTHGILGSLIAFEPKGGWSPKNADWFPDEQPELTLESRLWGSATLEFSAPEMSLNSADSGESLESSGGLARLSISDTGSSASILLKWPSISVSGPDMTVQIADVYAEQAMTHLQGDIWTGEGEMRVGSAHIEPAGQPAVTLQGFSVRGASEATPNGERVSSTGTFRLDKVSLQGESYGPHQMQLSLDNLDVDSWSRLSESLSELQLLAAQQKADGKNRFDQQMAAMTSMNTALRDLAAAGFSAGIPTLSLATPEGEVSGSVVISHPELTADQKSDMLLIMQRLKGKLSLKLPAALAENYPAVRMQVAPLIKQGLLVQEGDELIMAASLKDLMVDVNGAEIPLPPLL
jgi:uncharacterized protein YdgA (DUF945 family)